ncbi:MAG: glutathione S-transferase family protein [Bradyrhizobium sp.]|nr:glutathione S-transferase family protein [Bradyrhizobium sp.]
MEIYADPITVNCRKVLAGLQLMNIDYTLKKVDYFQSEQKSPAYIAINPNAALPAMRDGDLTLWESNAILQYAADKNGKAAFYPSEPRTRADINRWLFWECAHWFPSCYVFLVENCVKPLLGGAPDPATLEKEASNFHKLAGILDRRLAGSSWLCGNSPTIADIAVASPIHLHEWQQLPLDPHKNLTRWIIERVEQLPCWKNTMVYEGFTLQKAAA